MKKIIFFLLMVLLVFNLTGCKVEQTGNQQEKKAEVTKTFDIKGVSTIALKRMLQNENTLLVDTRHIQGFNGWILNDELRGGHIKGAVIFDADWLSKFHSDIELQNELYKFGITKKRNIITYGYGVETANKLANKLIELGYEEVVVYSDGFETWASDMENDVVSMKNYSNLVYPDWLKENIGFDDIKLYEVSSGVEGPETYIESGTHFNFDEIVNSQTGKFVSDIEVSKILANNGIDNDTTIVLYGNELSKCTMVGLLLKYFGVEDVRILDGGLKTWLESGYSLIDNQTINGKTNEKFDLVPKHPEYISDASRIKESIENKNRSLIFIGSWTEFIGEQGNLDLLEPVGRIKNSVYGFGGTDKDDMKDYINVDGTLMNYEFVEERWGRNNIYSNKENIFYSLTQTRASLAWFYSISMGWENSSVYDGGWKEWSQIENELVEIGTPQE